jgi:hypothetical protein
MSKTAKSSPEFTKLCELRHAQNSGEDPISLLQHFEAAINSDQPQKVKFYWSKLQVSVDEIIKEINFDNKSALKRFLTLTESS